MESKVTIRKGFVKDGEDDEFELLDMEIDFMSLVPKGANYTQKDGDTVLLMKSAEAAEREKSEKVLGKTENLVDKGEEMTSKHVVELKKRLASLKAAIAPSLVEVAQIESELSKLAEEETSDTTPVVPDESGQKPAETDPVMDKLLEAERRIGEMTVSHAQEKERMQAENAGLKAEVDELTNEIERQAAEAAARAAETNPAETK